MILSHKPRRFDLSLWLLGLSFEASRGAEGCLEFQGEGFRV